MESDSGSEAPPEAVGPIRVPSTPSTLTPSSFLEVEVTVPTPHDASICAKALAISQESEESSEYFSLLVELLQDTKARSSLPASTTQVEVVVFQLSAIVKV